MRSADDRTGGPAGRVVARRSGAARSAAPRRRRRRHGTDLLRGAELRYHGDVDRPGIAIADRLVAEIGVIPWRMGVGDYTAAVGRRDPRLSGSPLAGVPGEPCWDAELGAAMRRHDVEVHEEAVVADLLEGR